MTQGIQEQVRALATIEAKTHFVQIGREMLCADSMPRSNDAALQERESGFDCVGMNIAVNIDTVLVLDRFVFFGGNSSFVHGEGIRGEFVCNDHVNIFAHVLANVLRDRTGLSILSMEESKIAIALSNT